jgi:hypothetical protein
MHRLTNPFALAHTPSRRQDRFVARPVKISPTCDPARLPSKSAFLQLMPCDTNRAQRWTWSPITRACSTLVVLPPPGLALRPFTATMPCCFLQTRLSRLGPRSRPRIFLMRTLLWARRSLSTSATSFQLRHTSTYPRALPSPSVGDCPTTVATHDCAFNAALTILFLMQRWLELDAPQRAARIPRHPGSRPGPRRPVSLHPHERHLSGGPAGHGKRAGRKSGAKVNRISLARKTDPGKLTLRGPSSIALPNPSCHWRCVRDGMEARSRACTRPHHPPRLSFRSCSREGSRHSENRGAFHRGNRMTEGITP